MRVLFFDIDGTLILTGGAGKAALEAALSAEFGVEAPGEVVYMGRTDRGIVRNLFALHGIEDSDANWLRLQAAYLRELPRQLPLRRGRVLAGVAPLLSSLSGRPGFSLGLLTGNMRLGAHAKLTHYGLMSHFTFGGYGDLHPGRDEVAREALASAAERLGAVTGDAVWVIGDTPLDVACARAIGARCLAVATGGVSLEELAAANPDLLVESLSEPAVLKMLLDH